MPPPGIAPPPPNPPESLCAHMASGLGESSLEDDELDEELLEDEEDDELELDE